MCMLIVGLSVSYMRMHMTGRYHSDTQTMKIAQGVSGTVKGKGSVHDTLPFLCQAVRQGFQVLTTGLTTHHHTIYTLQTF